MSILTYPLNGITYDAEDAEVYLCTRTSGVFASDGHFPASVTGTRTVSIGPGLAWIQNEEFHGKAIYNPDTVDLSIAEADAYQGRIDRIVLQFDKLLNMTSLMVKQGTPSSDPKAPDIERDSLIYELGLYTVTVKASTISVSESDVASTFLDESVCGIMRDAVTGIPTQELYDQWYAWFSQMQTDTTEFEEQLNQWFKDIKAQTEKDIEENQATFDAWLVESQDEFDAWFANLQYVLDGDVAGHLEVEIEKAQNTANESIEMLMTGTARGFLMDENGNAIFAAGYSEYQAITNQVIAGQSTVTSENKGIIIEWNICNCETGGNVGTGGADRSEILDIVYPVGSIYMSVSGTSPALLFGGTWQQIQNRFLLAAGSSYSAGSTGGASTLSLTASQLPSHTHSLPSHTHSIPSHTHSIPSHTHSIPSLSGTAASAGEHTHQVGTVQNNSIGGDSRRIASQDNADNYFVSSSNGAHTHSVTTNSSTTGAYSGTSGSTSGTSGSVSGTSGSTGSGESINNMPPYMAVYMWQRTA